MKITRAYNNKSLMKLVQLGKVQYFTLSIVTLLYFQYKCGSRGVAHEAISPRWSVKPSLKFLYIDKVISIVFLSSCLDPPLYLQLKEFYRLVMKIKIISFFVFAYLMFLQLFLQLLFHFLFLVL